MNTPANTVLVACRHSDPLAIGVQKYANRSEWNVPGDRAPNGVNATRYVRKTAPDLEKLSPLARFLASNAPASVAGNMTHADRANRVCCYNGKTKGDMLRESENDKARAEALIRVYGLDREPACVEDWHFDVIEPGESDEAYWNRAAQGMIEQGVARVQIGAHEFSTKEARA